MMKKGFMGCLILFFAISGREARAAETVVPILSQQGTYLGYLVSGLKKVGFALQEIPVTLFGTDFDYDEFHGRYPMLICNRFIFTTEQRDVLKQYVEKGGTLILIGDAGGAEDVNGNYKYDVNIDKWNKMFFAGIAGCQFQLGKAVILKYEVTKEHPITEGMKIVEWTEVKPPAGDAPADAWRRSLFAVPVVSDVTGEVLMTARVIQNGQEREQALVVVAVSGLGRCIRIFGPAGSEYNFNSKGVFPEMTVVFENAIQWAYSWGKEKK